MACKITLLWSRIIFHRNALSPPAVNIFSLQRLSGKLLRCSSFGISLRQFGWFEFENLIYMALGNPSPTIVDGPKSPAASMSVDVAVFLVLYSVLGFKEWIPTIQHSWGFCSPISKLAVTALLCFRNWISCISHCTRERALVSWTTRIELALSDAACPTQRPTLAEATLDISYIYNFGVIFVEILTGKSHERWRCPPTEFGPTCHIEAGKTEGGRGRDACSSAGRPHMPGSCTWGPPQNGTRI